MTKVTFSSLKLKMNNAIKIFECNGNSIEVTQYLPIEDKMDLIDITLQNSKEGKLFNPIKVEMYFHLYLVYLYTNLTFTDKQKEDEEKLFDILDSNGIINSVIENIPEEEYDTLLEYLDEKMEIELNYITTSAAIFDTILEELPKSAQNAVDIMNEINNTPIQNVLNFAEAIGNKE